jgi:hypothetical protein
MHLAAVTTTRNVVFAAVGTVGGFIAQERTPLGVWEYLVQSVHKIQSELLNSGTITGVKTNGAAIAILTRFFICL